MIEPRLASGLRDLLPAAAIPRERMLEAFRRTFASFGFVPIETPHIERMEVLQGKGAGSDEVLRQIFEVTNRGGERGELALRFDLTVPLARFIARHVDELKVPFKRYAIGSVFRGERPAKGRFREFVQCDFDTIGTTSVVADAETVQVIQRALAEAGVADVTIALNHRKILDGLLDQLGMAGQAGAVLRAIDKRDKIGRDGVARELTRPFEDRIERRGDGDHLEGPETRPPLCGPEQAEAILDFIERGRGGRDVLAEAEAQLGTQARAAEGIANLREVLRLLEAAGVPESSLTIDLGLARGLDYYTGVVFETTVQGWERFGSICSGGRYDDLASLFTTRRLPGVGASIGLDRLLALLDEAGRLPAGATTVPVLVTLFPGVGPEVAVRLAARLRASGIGAEVYPEAIALGKQLGYGSARGHRLALIVGPDEQAQEAFNLRDLADRSERKGISWGDLEAAVGSALATGLGTTG